VLALLAAPARADDHSPVRVVADQRIAVGASALLPLYVSRDWSVPLPEVTRAVVVLHGYLRNADVYYRSALKARAAAGAAGASAIMIVPQFLTDIDVAAHRLPPETLRWSLEGWEGGEPATGPKPASSFDALDAILARLADRRLFPNLRDVVIAGHSGGAQVAQRYAVAGHATPAGLAVRYVVANPSSYAYFTPERPVPQIAAGCPRFNDWKYGMAHRPPYLAEPDPAALEQNYVRRRVILLLGTLDTDPNHPALDKSCMGEAQGPFRYARGHAYFAAMQARDGGLPNHAAWDVPGVGHDGDKMLTSPCGLQALFDVPGCAAAR